MSLTRNPFMNEYPMTKKVLFYARYSTDREWLVPHFEKMLYDNALLLRVYLHWWRATGDPLAERIVRETAEFLLRDMRTPEALAQAPLQMDARKHAKMTRGKLEPEARIDLHGMTLAQAHPELTHFILGAHAQGLRLVLVITGKGSSLGSEGALKRAVPLWFAMPEFRFIISSYEPAARHHGGEGALYVRLSRRGQDRR